jgi:hypothetical protein
VILARPDLVADIYRQNGAGSSFMILLLPWLGRLRALRQSVQMHSLPLGGRLVRQTVEQYTSIIMAGAKAAASLLLWT